MEVLGEGEAKVTHHEGQQMHAYINRAYGLVV